MPLRQLYCSFYLEKPSSKPKQEQNPNRNVSEFPLCFHGLTDNIGYFNLTNVIEEHLRHFWSSLRTRIGFANSGLLKNSQCSSHDESKEDSESTISRESAEIVMERLGLSCIKDGGYEGILDINSEFIESIFADKEPSLEEIKEAFYVFDENRDGFIDAEELQRVLCALGLNEGRGVDDCKSMIKNFDRNGDGKIDFQEFVKFMEDSFC